MSYGPGPYGQAPPTALSSSRKIDGTIRQYVLSLDGNGGFEPMDDIAQRVQLLLAFGVPAQKIITPQGHLDTAAAIRKALAPLTTGTPPAIRIDALDVGSDAPGATFQRVQYTNLLTGTQQTLLPDGTLIVHSANASAPSTT